ncbi:MAG: YczE/YyaS/YitT family protein [Culicoidibacterales bacterium]
MQQPLLAKKLVFYFGGMIAIGFGVAAIINSSLGAGSFDAFVAGLAGKLGITLGLSMNIIAISFLLISALVERKMPRFLSMITSIILGLIIDIWMLVIFRDITVSHLAWQWVLLLSGAFGIAFGVALMISSRMPLNPTDVPVIVMTEHFGLKIGTAKLLFDATMLILAFLLAGPIGIGTIVITFSLGPVIGILSRHTEHWMFVRPHKK